MGIHDGHRARLRQRLRDNGLDGFSPHEALEFLLFYAIPRQDTNAIAHSLLDRYGTLLGVLDAPEEDLVKVEGVGANTAMLLHFLPRFFRMALLETADTLLNTTSLRGEYLRMWFNGEQEERIYALCLDSRGKLLARRKIGDGDFLHAPLAIRALLGSALLTSASGVVLSHNHPGGCAIPSEADYAATEAARNALAGIQVELLDHIIVSGHDYVSLRDSGYFTEDP